MRFPRFVSLFICLALLYAANALAQIKTVWECVTVEGEWACYAKEIAAPNYPLPFSADRLSPVQTSADAREDAVQSLDWVPKNSLPPELRAQCPRGCEGGYLAPQRRDHQRMDDPADSPLEAETSLSELDSATGRMVLTGDVLFTQGWRQAGANKVVIDQENSNYELEGNITIREPGLLLTGESATVASTTGNLELTDAQYVLHDMRVQGTADSIRRTENGHIYIDNATYSTCEPTDTDWLLSARQIEIDQQKARIVAKNMRITTGPVTLFYAPSISFPLGSQRKSGLLYPVLENSSRNGLDFSQPLYLNLAPQYDVTLTPRLIEERGAMLQSEFRWLTKATSGQVAAGYLPQDKGAGDENIYQGEDRWLAQIDADMSLFGGHSGLDLTTLSDRNYFSDLGSGSLQSNSQTWLLQHFYYHKNWNDWRLNISGLSYEKLTAQTIEGYKELPRLQLQGYWQNRNGSYVKLYHEAVRFEPFEKSVAGSVLQSDSFGELVSGDRVSLAYSVGWRRDRGWYFTDAEIYLDAISYQLSQPLVGSASSSPALLAPGIRLESGFAFERRTQIFSQTWTQTLEPRLQFVYINADPQDNQPVFDSYLPQITYLNSFRVNPFGGGDRIADSKRFSVGLESRLLSLASGQQMLRFGVAQQFYLHDRQVHLSPRVADGLVMPDILPTNSPLYFQAQLGQRELSKLSTDRSSLNTYIEASFPGGWFSRILANWSQDDSQVDSGSFEVGYRSPYGGSIVNLAYRYENAPLVYRDINNNNLVESGELYTGDIEQLDFSTVIEFADHWTMIGRWQQDFSHQRPLEIFAGAKYDSCCWSASLLWRHWLKRNESELVPEANLSHDSGIFVSFELKGLAGVGDQLENLLRESIPGY